MTWYAVGIAAVGAVSSLAGGAAGQKAAEEAGKRQAELIKQTSAENIRRRKLDLEQKLGTINAQVGASNIMMSGSAQRYKNVFAANTLGEMRWDEQKARLDAEMARKGGQLTGQGAMHQGVGGALSFGAQAAGRFGE
jgi:hypothetical protein